MKLVGILLSYYDDYSVRALSEFRKLLNGISPDAEVVLVCNGSFVSSERADGVHVVRGDNTLREFSGWDSGIAYCRSQRLFADAGLVVFANDTFCHHNKFGFVSRAAFRRAFREMMAVGYGPAIAGEVLESGAAFRIDDLRAQRWVSSYLFAMTIPLVERLGSVIPCFAMDDLFNVNPGDPRLFGDGVCEHLRSHVEGWLLGRGRAKWYRAEPLTEESRARLTAKARSIVCEMYLTAACIDEKAAIVDVFGPRGIRRLRRFERSSASRPMLEDPMAADKSNLQQALLGPFRRTDR